MKTVYLDYNATTPLDERVARAMRSFESAVFANPSSVHRAGQEARHALERAREALAGLLGVKSGEITFTSGGTESNNLALAGSLRARGPEGRRRLAVSRIEHPSVMGAARALEREGFIVDWLDVTREGRVLPETAAAVIGSDTALVSVMHANNETGAIQPIEAIARLAREKGAWMHADAVQSFGKTLFKPADAGIDIATISAHKIYGPKGVGALWCRPGVKLRPILHGGHQEKNIRPGTESVAAIAGFAEAAHIAVSGFEAEGRRLGELRDRLRAGLEREAGGVVVNGTEPLLPQTLNASFAGLDGSSFVMNLDLEGIQVSSGSACAAGSVDPSHVLIAMGLGAEILRGAVRFSLGRFTTAEEVDRCVACAAQIAARLRKHAPLS